MSLPSLPQLLRVNAAYSLTAGSLALIARGSVSTALVVPEVVVMVLGVGLLAFAFLLAWLARGGRVTGGAGLWIAAADGAWVVAVAVFTFVTEPPSAGVVLAVAASMPVATLAVLQMLAAVRLIRPDLQTVEWSRAVSASPADLWPVMTDHQLYAKLAPNLSRVELLPTEPNASGYWRRCWDVRGNHWDETLRTWEPPYVYSADVVTDADDYPYPMSELRGLWSLSEGDAGAATVTMRFEFRPQAGLAGAAFAKVLSATAPTMMRRIIDGWEREALSRRDRV
jgi:ribosome-associated toxin RatA of RatAB toxin-antitoxin module